MSEPRKMDFLIMWCSLYIFIYNYPPGHKEVDLFITDEILLKHSMDINTIEQIQSFY